MSLQFKNFKSKLARKKYLELDFSLEENFSLAIVDDSENLELIRKVFRKKAKYDGEVFLNGKNIKEKSSPNIVFTDNIGFYSKFSLLQNLKYLLKLFKIKLSKELLNNYAKLLNLDLKNKYGKLNASEIEKFHILFLSLIEKELLFFNFENIKLTSEDEILIQNFIYQLIEEKNRNIIIYSKNINKYSEKCIFGLVISDNKQSFFGELSELSVIKGLVILDIVNYDEEKLFRDLHFDFKLIANKLIIRKEDLEDILYYFVKTGVEVQAINDFNENTSLYEVKE